MSEPVPSPSPPPPPPPPAPLPGPSATTSAAATTTAASWVTTTTFQGLLRTHSLNVNSSVDLIFLMISETERACELIKTDFLDHKGLRFHLSLNLRMSKITLSAGETVTVDPHFSSPTKIVHNMDVISDL